jgi:hypothetical protein
MPGGSGDWCRHTDGIICRPQQFMSSCTAPYQSCAAIRHKENLQCSIG